MIGLNDVSACYALLCIDVPTETMALDVRVRGSAEDKKTNKMYKRDLK